MSFVSAIGSSCRDLIECGPRFWLGGICANLKVSNLMRVTLPGGNSLYVRPGESDFLVVRQVFRNCEYRIPAVAADRVKECYNSILAEGLTPVIIDGGANIGAASIWFHQQFPEAAIIAIEPDPASAAIARENLAPLKGVELMEAAIGGDKGCASIIPSAHSWATQTERSKEGVPIVTVPDAVAQVPNGKLFLVKIDIEGFELDLFSTNTGWLDEVMIVYVEPHEWLFPGKHTSGAFQREIGRRDFDLFIVGENVCYLRSEILAGTLKPGQQEAGARVLHSRKT